MKRLAVAVTLCIALAGLAFAQEKPQDKPKSIGGELSNTLRIFENQFISAAEAMPEDKYGFAPSQGEFKNARTYAAQIKHVAAANYFIFAVLTGDKPPANVTDEEGPKDITSKADIVKFARESFAYAHKQLQGLDAQSALKTVKSPFGNQDTTPLLMGTLGISHVMDHYGQMAIYLRMNNIVPPATARQQQQQQQEQQKKPEEKK